MPPRRLPATPLPITHRKYAISPAAVRAQTETLGLSHAELGKLYEWAGGSYLSIQRVWTDRQHHLSEHDLVVLADVLKVEPFSLLHVPERSEIRPAFGHVGRSWPESRERKWTPKRIATQATKKSANLSLSAATEANDKTPQERRRITKQAL